MKKVLLSMMTLLLLVSCQKEQKNESAELIPLRMAYPASGTIISAQVGQVLERTDILKKHGFDAKVTAMGTGREMKTALTGDQIDVMMTSESNFIVLRGQGFDAIAFSSLGSAGRVGLMTAANSEINSVADLKGKKIATIFGTSLHRPAVIWAKEAGGAEVINIPKTGTIRSSIETGAIAAGTSLDPYIESDLKSGTMKLIASETFDLINVMSRSYKEKHPGVISKLNAALREAVYYMATHHDEANGWFSEVSKLDVGIIDISSVHNANYNAKSLEEVDLSISEEYLKKLEELAVFLKENDLIQQEVEVRANVIQE